MFSGYLAAIFLAVIALTIIAQILGRFINVTIDSTETAGFSLAALTFFGLAYTFRSGEHIRVTLIKSYNNTLVLTKSSRSLIVRLEVQWYDETIG